MHVQDKLEEGVQVDLIEGQLEQSLHSIDAGRSAEFRYVVIPRSRQGAFVASPAQVTYIASEGQAPTTLLSTSSPVKVLSFAQNMEVKLVKLVRARLDEPYWSFCAAHVPHGVRGCKCERTACCVAYRAI